MKIETMKTAAVICEFNPFHAGHAYLLHTLRKEGFDRVVCFMSGNFVQRGEPAVIDKYVRAEAALHEGADLVIEMPVIFSTSSAADFASAGVRMAAASGICTHLAFGIEEGEDPYAISELERNERMREFLKEGKTYPEAAALVLGKTKCSPNALLAGEYLRAMKNVNALTPYPVIRKGSGYDDAVLHESGYPSAKAIRVLAREGKASNAAEYLPEDELSVLCEEKNLSFPDSLSLLLSDRLLRENDFIRYLDVSREISDRLLSRKNVLMSFSDRVEDTKTRQYTRSRIQRALLHITLGITKEQSDALKDDGWFRYYRVLSYRKESGLLSEIKKSTDIPVISRTADLLSLCPEDFRYDQLYYALTNAKSEYLRSPIII